MNFWESMNHGAKVKIYPVTARDLMDLERNGFFGCVYFGTFYRFFPESVAVLPIPGFKPGHENEYECVAVARTADGVILAVKERGNSRGDTPKGAPFGVGLPSFYRKRRK